MITALPEHPRMKAQHSRVVFVKRVQLVEKEAALKKTLYGHKYRPRKRKKAKEIVIESRFEFQTKPVLARGEIEQPKVIQEPENAEIAEKVERSLKVQRELSTLFARDLTLTFSKPLLQVQERLQAAIREVTILPKLKIFSAKFDELLGVQRMHQDVASKALQSVFNAHSEAMRDSLRVHSRLAEMLKGVSLRTQVFDKLLQAQRLPQLAISNALSEMLEAQRKAIQEAVRTELLSYEASLTEEQRDFRHLLNLVREDLDIPSEESLNAVLQIQTTTIPAEMRTEAIWTLAEFVRKHRSSNLQNVVVAVGAAIRKVLLNVSDDDLELATELMKPAGNLEIPVEVDLEVAKMVVHRFRYSPSTPTTNLKELVAILLDNALTYCKPNLVNRDFYGAAALNSALSVVLMRHEKVPTMIDHIEAVSPAWFIDLVKSRLRRMAKEMAYEKLEGSEELVALMLAVGSKLDQSTLREGS